MQKSFPVSFILLICALSKPRPLICGELILIKSPQEGAETRDFLLELRAWNWLGEVEAWRLVRQDERRVI